MIDPSYNNETNKTLDESDLSHVFEQSKNCSSSYVSSAIFSKHGEESPVKTDTLAQSEATITNRDLKKVKHNSCFNSNSNHGNPSKDTELLSQPESSLPDQKSKKGKTMKGKDKIPISQVVKKFPRNAVVPQSSKLNYSQKNAHVTTSYWNRKKGLNKHRVGRPRKDFDQCKFDAKKSNPSMLNDPSSVENIVSTTCIHTHESPGRNSRTKMKKKRLRGHEDSGDYYPGKQVEASVTEDGSKKKRGRPKFIKKTASTISEEEKFALAMKKVSVKTKGRSKNFIPIKMSSRPKSPRNAALLGVTVGQIISGAFVQHVNCLNDKMKIPKCRECRQAAYNRSTWAMSNSYCRFLEYRKLFIDIDGSILLAGFLQPLESTDSDKSLWLPNVSFPPKDLTRETSKELLIQVGDQFCDLVQQEKDAVSLHMGPDKNITWKKLVPGVREMCDVCETTLFNIHWVCHKCGFAVCIDCYKVRKQGVIIDEGNQIKGRDDYLWFSCHNRVPHEQDQMMMAQMVPGNALWSMNEIMHRVREEVTIPAYCKCAAKENMSTNKNSVTTGICKQLMSHVSKSFATINCLHTNNNDSLSICAHNLNIKIPKNALQWVQQWEKADSKSNELAGSRLSPKDANGLEFITQNQTGYNVPMHEYHKLIIKAKEGGCGEVEKCTSDTSLPLNNRYPKPSGGRKPLPVRIFTSVESEMLFKNQCHSWLCHGRLLLLHQSDHEGNLEVFREQWKRGQPIMVARVDRKLDMSLWHPSGFCRDFGDIVNDLVNCQTGAIIRNLPMSKFWLGFENLDQRMKDDSGEYMLLKLKDWPPGEDFSEKLPKRFRDLMKGLPLPEYTHRNGIFNLAGRLPSWFVRPDLGPKMYNAYGSALYPTKGTTNLHLDISDAVNVMVYVGVPHDGKDEEHIFQALKAIDDGGCDSLTRERVRSKGVKPGALWHIYDYRSVDKIRDFLTKVAIERGEKLEAHHDPIHDQSWYLDTELRRRLFAEYGVQGYAIAQCLGDAVFIPAGAPHQVRNLHSCVKVAEDFVSPENIAHCFKLTQEFRHLSDTHTNHEDKLQIKNIIYHVVKDALSHLIKK